MKRINGNLSWALSLSVVLATVLTIVSCGGGSSNGTPASTAVITKGVITGFGSVIVDGVEFTTDATTSRRHLDDGAGVAGSDDQTVFAKGMVVSVQHQAGSNKAMKIDFVNNLEGPVSGATASGCTVLGVPVTISANTVIRPNIAALVNGAIAEVSGVPDASGAIPATFIELKPAGTKNVFQIKGIVSNVNTSNKTCSLATVQGATSGISVDFSSAVIDSGIGLSNGAFVEVKTDLAGSAASPIKATKVEAAHESEVESENEIEQHHSGR